MIENYSDIIPMLINDVNGCHNGILLNTIGEAVHDICQETECFKKSIEITVDVDGLATLDLGTYTDGSVKRVNLVERKDTGAIVTSDKYNVEYDKITIIGSEEDEIFVVKVSIVPFPTATSLDADVLNRLFSCVKARVLSILMKQPTKPYTNLDLSAYDGEKIEYYFIIDDSVNQKQSEKRLI